MIILFTLIKMPDCKSLRDLHLYFTYAGVAGHRANFHNVPKRSDAVKCKESIKSFQSKINAYKDKTKYELKFGVSKTGIPYLELSPKSPNMSIAKLIRYICHEMDKKISVSLKHKTCIYNTETQRCRIK
jgi:hypothetical protein